MYVEFIEAVTSFMLVEQQQQQQGGEVELGEAGAKQGGPPASGVQGGPLAPGVQGGPLAPGVAAAAVASGRGSEVKAGEVKEGAAVEQQEGISAPHAITVDASVLDAVDVAVAVIKSEGTL